MKTTFALAFAVSIGLAAAANAAAMHGGSASHAMPSGSHIQTAASTGPHSPVTQVKIRTPRQCFRYCRGTLGAGVDFCAVSCYR
jgi:hypothetical protein